MNALGGIAETIDPMVVCAAKTVALSGAEADRGRSRARGGAAASSSSAPAAASAASAGSAPLCDYDPPIHFRWPEYVTTPRGRDWWIPPFPMHEPRRPT